ncbi:uncharacterized protein L969DRAFT_49564 [Mixia osmundae IAM 14324]|uniref:Uncharacterized protein n=1 Tax=Mixia osmundae (strain CBS 9802 / IAM 14324 / JCM 22182 / KY 12970) TaxID=764103 RepID=G7E3A7_MIXOS|nr:uncharacterized protein L969DRAFT_49564 [Mixia osmundae IAM 14324]KEI39304.1 hypothetical protein L969DRAFT_49564 [Mixia osmundae IAM 14324]GAA97317.1 hypothetical protein E5Q_03995 [Mixia osmundae IAM 14324]
MAAQLMKDLEKVESKVAKLGKIIAKGTSIGLIDATKLGSMTRKVTGKVKKATVTAEKTTISPAEGAKLIAFMQALTATSAKNLDAIAALKPHLSGKLHVGGLVKMNLSQLGKRLWQAQEALAKTLVARSPTPELKAKGEALRVDFNGKICQALAVYANESGGEDKAGEEDDEDSD